MAYITTAELNLIARFPERKTAAGAGQKTAGFDHVFEFIASYANGTGASKVDAVYSERITVSGATTRDLRGSLTGETGGSTAVFPIVVGLFLVNLSTTAGETVHVGGGGSNPWITWLGAAGDLVKVGPGGFLALWSPVDGYATTAGTADILTLDRATGSPQVDLLIVGRQS